MERPIEERLWRCLMTIVTAGQVMLVFSLAWPAVLTRDGAGEWLQYVTGVLTVPAVTMAFIGLFDKLLRKFNRQCAASYGWATLINAAALLAAIAVQRATGVESHSLLRESLL